ncbi:MAG: DnaJ domain-containing protein [Proteobacteria bacterium]|nr:DnaJ domain-containing protein [Pseudomonadota bacterium]
MTREEALAIFGFSEIPDNKTIQSIYKKKAIATHPDKTAYPEGATQEQKEVLRKEREEAFKKLGEAYSILTNPEKNALNNDFQFNDAEALFKSFFSSFGFKDSMPKEKYQLNVEKKSKRIGWNGATSMHFFNDFEGLKKSVTNAAEELGRELENKIFHYPYIEIFLSTLPEEFITQYDTNHSENLTKALLKNTKLVEISAPRWLFSDAQRASLEQHMKPQREAKAKIDAIEAAKQKKKTNFDNDQANRAIFWSRLTQVLAAAFTGFAVIGSGGALTPLIIIKTIFYSTMAAIFTYAVTKLIFVARGVFLKMAEEDYNGRLDKVTDPAEIEAMQGGVKSINNWEYAKTYIKLPAYTCYRAHLYGYSQAMQEESEVVAQINKLKAH